MIQSIPSPMHWRHILIGKWSWMRPIYSLAFIYASLSLFGCFFADRLIFLPPAPGYPADSPGLLALPTTQKESIAAIHLPSRDGKPCLLYSHGNAEDIGGVLPLLSNWHDQGFGVFAYDYPGYGQSTGRPTEASCERAIAAAWQHLTGPAAVPPGSVVVVGRSVGSGPAVWLASHEHPAALVLISPLMSAYRVRLPAPIFPGDRFPNLKRMPKLDLPLLILHGERDRIIPPRHGRRLFAAHPGPDKNFVEIPGAGHNDLFLTGGTDLNRSILEFAERTAR